MTQPDLAERVSRLEARIDSLERIERHLEHIDQQLTDFRAEQAQFRAEQANILGRILGSIQDLQQRPVVFRWPWEPFRP